jgi:hypothetical protein
MHHSQDAIDRELVDLAFNAYVRWRDECRALWDAHNRWASASSDDGGRAYAAYTIALDIEERASMVYAGAMLRAGLMVTLDGHEATTFLPPAWRRLAPAEGR